MGAEEKNIPNDLDRIGIDRNAPVGVFDSGIGGLTVAREIMLDIGPQQIIFTTITNANRIAIPACERTSFLFVFFSLNAAIRTISAIASTIPNPIR